jgi:predicted PurR-regulated permease PerM
MLLGVTGAALLAFGYYLRAIFNPLLLALLIAYILNPVISFFERLKISRTVSISALYVIIITAFFCALANIGPLVWSEITHFCTAAFEGDGYIDLDKNGTFTSGDTLESDLNRNWKYDPAYITSFMDWAKEKVAKWNETYPDNKIDFDDMLEKAKKSVQDNWREVTSAGLDVTGWIAGAIASGLSGLFFVLSYLVLVPAYVFFLLRGMNRIKAVAASYLPALYKDQILTIARKIDIAVSSFFRGKLIICVLKGILVGVGLYVIGVRFSLLFAFVVAIAALVPYVVVIIGWIPAVALVILDSGVNWWMLGGTLGVFVAVEVLESIVLTPFLLGKETGLHPLTVIISLFIGGELFGLFGVILSIPLTCIAKILAQELLLPQLKALSAQGQPGSAGKV